MPDPALEDQSPTEYDACTARNHAFHDGWNARQRRRPSQGQGWSFEENLAANWGLLPPGRWADVQGAEQSPAGPGREVQASLQAAGQQSGELRRRVDELEAESERHRYICAKSQDTAQRALEALAEVRASEADLTQRLAQAWQQSGELRRRVDELESENKWLRHHADTADDAARSACEALAEVRASEADLTQRLAQMEAVAALGPEPGGREEHVVPRRRQEEAGMWSCPPGCGGRCRVGVQQLCNMVAELRLRDPRLVLTWKVIWSVVDAAGYCVPPPEVVDWAFRTAEEAPIADLTDAVLASCSAAGPRAEQERLL